MTTYNNISDAEIAIDKPVTSQLLTKMRDNILAMQEQDASNPNTLQLQDYTHLPNYTAGEKIRFMFIVGQNFFNAATSGAHADANIATAIASNIEIKPPTDNQASADHFDGVKIRAKGTYRVRVVMWHKKTSGTNLTTTIKVFKGGAEETISSSAFLANTTNSTSYSVHTAVKDIAFERDDSFKINIARSTDTKMLCYVIFSTAESGSDFAQLKDANSIHSNSDPEHLDSSPILNPEQKPFDDILSGNILMFNQTGTLGNFLYAYSNQGGR